MYADNGGNYASDDKKYRLASKEISGWCQQLIPDQFSQSWLNRKFSILTFISSGLLLLLLVVLSSGLYHLAYVFPMFFYVVPLQAQHRKTLHQCIDWMQNCDLKPRCQVFKSKQELMVSTRDQERRLKNIRRILNWTFLNCVLLQAQQARISWSHSNWLHVHFNFNYYSFHQTGMLWNQIEMPQIKISG